MSLFKTAASVEQIVWQMRLADWPRAQNRVLIDEQLNGEPPYTEQEEAENNFSANYNNLNATKINQDARSQLDNAFLSTDPLFTVNLDYGPAHKRVEWSGDITKLINKPILASPEYFDVRQGVFAGVVSHGVGPAVWEDKQLWCPVDVGIEDVLIPSNTLRSMRNLPFYAVWRSYTFNMLYEMTHGPRVDPGWNIPLVDKHLQWIDQQTAQLIGQNWPNPWTPESMHERFKQDGGAFASDAVPTVDVFDFRWWNDRGKESGWSRKIILDAWSMPGTGGIGLDSDWKSIGNRRFDHGKNEFLYDSGERKFADSLDKMIHFQFGDASAKSPFRYHSVRSLGWMLYSVCEIQNRLNCRFTDTAFEQMLQYLRVANPADMDRLTKVDLVDKGILPEGLNFVRPEERWQVNPQVPSLVMQMNRQMMADVSSAFTQDVDFMDTEKTDETATRTMAKVNSSAALIGSILNRAYAREKLRYMEICRRFCIKDSKDPDVRRFRVNCLKRGIPEEALNVDAWDIQPVRVMGQGNKLLQVAMADKVMSVYQLLEPTAQKEALRSFIAAVTGDWALAKALVPETKTVSNSSMSANDAVGPLMMGVPRPLQEGINHTEYVQELLVAMAMIVKRIDQSGGMGTPQEVIGLQTMGAHIAEHIKVIAQDKGAKGLVKQYGDALGGLMNHVKAFAQRLQEQSQQQNGGATPDPKDAAKAQAMVIQAQTKAQIQSKSHAQKTAQRQLQWEQQMKHQEQQAQFDLRKKAAETAIDLHAEHTKNRMRSFEE